MKKSCKYCGRTHDIGETCLMKPQPVKKRTKQNDIRCRNSWTEKSLEIRERDRFLCRMCLASGRINYTGIEVHHIIPLAENDDFAFENDWLISLCARHHKQADSGKISRKQLHELACLPPPLSVIRARENIQDQQSTLRNKIFRK